ncbi:MAG: low molecular weight phosphotyrosine protein phosphatase [Flavobacteriales bacterium]|nr:low molecular weight phosphotyrosine protein phosphatase [Flavobacteriales bacterium]
MKNVLMVCLGNICRSPMAEGILRAKAKERNIAISTDSAGTSSWHQGEKADARARETMRSKGIAIDDLRSRPFSPEDFDLFDYIFVMDRKNFADIFDLAKTEAHKQKIKLYLEESSATKVKEVPDPYYGEDDGFEVVYELLVEATDRFLDRI